MDRFGAGDRVRLIAAFHLNTALGRMTMTPEDGLVGTVRDHEVYGGRLDYEVEWPHLTCHVPSTYLARIYTPTREED